jgi:Tfp pilus assembly protein PilE
MLNIKSLDLRSDAAENSIMQTITIAVSAILIAAGLVTAPGLINNARDNNARTDLANIAYAEEFNLANEGKYAADLAKLKSNTEAQIAAGNSGPRLTLSGGTKVAVKATADAYTLYAQSQSGKVFQRTNTSAEVTRVTTAASLPADVATAFGPVNVD